MRKSAARVVTVVQRRIGGRPRPQLLSQQALGRGVTPSSVNGLAQDFSLRDFEDHAGGAASSPRSFYRNKHVGIVFGKVMLRFGRELDHAAGLVGIAERGKDFSCHPKIRMVHVNALFGLGQRESDLAEILSGHGRSRKNGIFRSINPYHKPREAWNVTDAPGSDSYQGIASAMPKDESGWRTASAAGSCPRSQRLKPERASPLSACLKACPDTNPCLSPVLDFQP